MTTYHSSRELEGRQLVFGDVLVFGNSLYYVEEAYLYSKDENNENIFNHIGVEKVTFCNDAYGYNPKSGRCPECNTNDFAALTRLAVAIFRKLEGSSETTYSSKPTSIMSNVLDFFRNITTTPNDKLLKELGIENPTNVPTELGLKLSQEITYVANRTKIIEIALQMKADADAKRTS